MIDDIPLLFPVWLLYGFGIAAVGVALVAIASTATAVTRRWHSTRRLGFLSTLGAVAVLFSAMLTMMISSAIADVPHDDPVTAATRIGRSVSALMNATGPAVPGAIVGALTWFFARRQGQGHPGKQARP